MAAVLLLLLAVGSAFLLAPAFGVVALFYIANNLLYNWVLKNQVILDVFSIGAGFVLRAVGGAVAVDVAISEWLYVLTALGITVGYHRLFVHRSFETYVGVKFAWAILGSMAVQGSLFEN